VRELRRDREDHPRHRRSLSARILASGVAASAASAAVALACSHRENGHAARPMNAVTHIVDGGPPPGHDGENGRNTALGLTIHTGASIFWAVFFETLLGRPARKGVGNAVAASAAIAATAYVVDYYVVGQRFRPGFERYLSGRSLFAVYAALAAGYAAAALLTRQSKLTK
jgi:hypothetical protein